MCVRERERERERERMREGKRERGKEGKSERERNQLRGSLLLLDEVQVGHSLWPEMTQSVVLR